MIMNAIVLLDVKVSTRPKNSNSQIPKYERINYLYIVNESDQMGVKQSRSTNTRLLRRFLPTAGRHSSQ